MKPITAQDIFNAAWQAFIIEGKPPAVEPSPTRRHQYVCRYQTPRGHRCAIGLVIPDDHPALTCLGPFSDVVNGYPELWDEALINNDPPGPHYIDLNDFQAGLHDNLVDFATGEWKATPEERRTQYEAVAAAYNLTIPETEHEV